MVTSGELTCRGTSLLFLLWHLAYVSREKPRFKITMRRAEEITYRGKSSLINMNDLLFVIWCLLDAENDVIDLLNSQFLNIASII